MTWWLFRQRTRPASNFLAAWRIPSCSSPNRPTDVEEAKALCLDCPIRERCLAGALERREPWGVWGGELFIGGVVVARKRPRGRPRKYPLADPFAPAARREGNEAAA